MTGSKNPRLLRPLQLTAIFFFTVSGGPYGLEPLLHDVGRTVELGRGPSFRQTEEGRLLGHVHLRPLAGDSLADDRHHRRRRRSL
jgi:hypothetical protein